MVAKERLLRILDFDTGIRTMKWEMGYWVATIKRWEKEGLPVNRSIPNNFAQDVTVSGEAIPTPEFANPADYDVHDAMRFDGGVKKVNIEHWIYPHFERTVLEETENKQIIFDENGITMEIMTTGGSIPRCLKFPVADRKDFEELKCRLDAKNSARFPEDWINTMNEYHSQGYPTAVGGRPVGFFGVLRDLMGFEGACLGYYEQPELVHDILNYLTDFWIDLYEEVLSKVSADIAFIWEDMSYKNGSLISPRLFREFMLPCYKRLTDFFRSKGIKNILVDTDGDCMELIPLFLEGGVTGMYPFEVQAGMDIAKIADQFPRLQILGGIDKVAIRKGGKYLDNELEKVQHALKRGGFVPYADHLIPPDVSWEEFKAYRVRLDKVIDSTKE
jgi:uroporphyrinogen decarboxylase